MSADTKQLGFLFLELLSLYEMKAKKHTAQGHCKNVCMSIIYKRGDEFMRMKTSDRADYGPWRRRFKNIGCFAFDPGGMKALSCYPKLEISSSNILLPNAMRIPDEQYVFGFISYNLESGFHEIWYPRSLKMKEKRMVMDFFDLKGYIYRFRVYTWPLTGFD